MWWLTALLIKIAALEGGGIGTTTSIHLVWCEYNKLLNSLV